MNRVTYLSSSIKATSVSDLSPISSFRALHRGKATPMQIRVSLLRLSLSFFANRPSAEREGFFFLVGSTLGRFFGFSAMLLLAALSSPLPSRCQVKPSRTRHFLCASAGMSPQDTKYKKNKYWKIPRGVRGAERLNQRCVISSCSGLGETDIYRHVEVTHYSFNFLQWVFILKNKQTNKKTPIWWANVRRWNSPPLISW